MTGAGSIPNMGAMNPAPQPASQLPGASTFTTAVIISQGPPAAGGVPQSAPAPVQASAPVVSSAQQAPISSAAAVAQPAPEGAIPANAAGQTGTLTLDPLISTGVPAAGGVPAQSVVSSAPGVPQATLQASSLAPSSLAPSSLTPSGVAPSNPVAVPESSSEGLPTIPISEALPGGVPSSTLSLSVSSNPGQPVAVPEATPVAAAAPPDPIDISTFSLESSLQLGSLAVSTAAAL